MSFTLGVFTFINVWWITLFVVLPFNVKTEESQSPVEYAAAPKSPRWKKIILINTCISLLVTLVLALLIHNDVVELKNLNIG